MKYLILLILIYVNFTLFAYGISEEDIPPAENIIELPSEIVGTFLVQSTYDNVELKIYATNKYSIDKYGDDYSYSEYGHIIILNDKYYLSAIKKGYVTDISELYFENETLYFTYSKKIKLKCIPKINLEPSDLSKKIQIENYIFISEIYKYSNKKDKEIKLDLNIINQDISYSLFIKDGIVYLHLVLKDGSVLYKGILDVLEYENDIFEGKILFNSGSSITFIPSMEGKISKKNNEIIIEIEKHNNIYKKYNSELDILSSKNESTILKFIEKSE